MHCEKDWKDNRHNSLHLGRKYAQMFALGHYLFLEAHSFPQLCSLKTVHFSVQKAYFHAKWRLLFIDSFVCTVKCLLCRNCCLYLKHGLAI